MQSAADEEWPGSLPSDVQNEFLGASISGTFHASISLVRDPCSPAICSYPGFLKSSSTRR